MLARALSVFCAREPLCGQTYLLLHHVLLGLVFPHDNPSQYT